MEIEYCSKCIDGICDYHKWFTDKNPQSDKEVLITFLERISKFEIREVFRKVYLVENVINDWNDNYLNVGGELTFDFKKLITVGKKDGIYIPISMCALSDDVLSYDIEINVTLMRHHPTEIIIKKDAYKDEIMYLHTLIDFNDSLHCESIEDYPEIVKLASSRLHELINQIRKEEKIWIKMSKRIL